MPTRTTTTGLAGATRTTRTGAVGKTATTGESMLRWCFPHLAAHAESLRGGRLSHEAAHNRMHGLFDLDRAVDRWVLEPELFRSNPDVLDRHLG